MKLFAVKLPLLALLLAGFVAVGPASTQAQDATATPEPGDGDCPGLTRVDHIPFDGAIFYNSSDAQYTTASWRLTPDLHSQPTSTLPDDYNAHLNKAGNRFELVQGQSLIFMDSTGIVREQLPLQENWNYFMGWTNDDRLLFRRVSEDQIDNGYFVVSLDGQSAFFGGFPNAISPDSDMDFFSVSPDTNQVAYQAFWPNTASWARFGLALADVATRKELWRSTSNRIFEDWGYAEGRNPYWSDTHWAPDGKRFAYVRRSFDYDVEIALVDNSGHERIVTGINRGAYFYRVPNTEYDWTVSGTLYMPFLLRWKPDSSAIAFWKDDFMPWLTAYVSQSELSDSDAQVLTLLDLKDQTVHSLCVSSNRRHTFQWSPDGKLLVFNSLHHLWLIDPEQMTYAQLPIEDDIPRVVLWMSDN